MKSCEKVLRMKKIRKQSLGCVHLEILMGSEEERLGRQLGVWVCSEDKRQIYVAHYSHL